MQALTRCLLWALPKRARQPCWRVKMQIWGNSFKGGTTRKRDSVLSGHYVGAAAGSSYPGWCLTRGGLASPVVAPSPSSSFTLPWDMLGLVDLWCYCEFELSGGFLKASFSARPPDSKPWSGKSGLRPKRLNQDPGVSAHMVIRKTIEKLSSSNCRKII